MSGNARSAPLQLFIALDLPSASEALVLISKIGRLRSASGLVSCGLKVGLELFTSAGPDFVRRQVDETFSVFVDLKFHDIPNTVYGAVKAACALGAQMLTLHLEGGGDMCRAAVQARDEVFAALGKSDSRGGASFGKTLLLGVSILTSTGGEAGEIRDRVLDFAGKAQSWALDGLVCSGHEVADVKKSCGENFYCLCPGIRFAGTVVNDDQSRICSPADAVRLGADFLVMGRPVTNAPDPALAVVAALAEMEKGLRQRT
ncbi:MAG: orotidine-5'-phosphate decarboxylase [Desulfovibrio sp.]|nr:orotidine-5'-phosphate decarboxylase [Desulfovibrio sp.]